MKTNCKVKAETRVFTDTAYYNWYSLLIKYPFMCICEFSHHVGPQHVALSSPFSFSVFMDSVSLAGILAIVSQTKGLSYTH